MSRQVAVLGIGYSLLHCRTPNQFGHAPGLFTQPPGFLLCWWHESYTAKCSLAQLISMSVQCGLTVSTAVPVTTW
jgi:hypothetical protein